MTTLDNRPGTALLVIDAQNGVMAQAHQRDEVIGKIGEVVAKARAAQVPVVWVQHSSEELPRGSDQWRIVPELRPAPDEPIVHKRYGDSFEATDLEEILAQRGAGRLVLSGAQTDACVRSTLHGAFVRGYDVTLVSDAHTTEDLTPWGAPEPAAVIAHTNLYWSFQSAPGRAAAVVAAAELDLDRTSYLT